MLTPNTPSPLQATLAQLNDPGLLWQLGLLCASLALAWLLTYALHRRFPETPGPGLKLDGISHVLLPLTVLLLLLLGKAVLQQWMPVGVLRVLIALAFAYTLMRGISHVLRMAFEPSELLQWVDRTLSAVVLIALALHLTGLHHAVIATLDDIGVSVGKQRISLRLALEAAISMLVTVVLVLWIGRLIEARVMRTEALEHNLRIVLSKIARGLLLLVGLLIALPLAGIDITLLSVFGGALGVGLGFGLQRIASNYVSGFIILLDKSMQIGDVISVDKHYGMVSDMRARYMVLSKPDGTHVIIPNESLITTAVVNHSLTEHKGRVQIELAISVDSPLELALQLLQDIAKQHTRVLQTPAPVSRIKGFNEHGVGITLTVWVADPESGVLGLQSALYMDIWKVFRLNKISFVKTEAKPD